MGAILKSRRSDRAVPALPLYLFARWLAGIPAFFVFFVCWGIIDPTAGGLELHRPWTSGAHFWTVAVIAAILAATYLIPLWLRSWYDQQRVRAGRSPAGVGCGWLFYLSFLWPLLIGPNGRMMTDPDRRAAIFPLRWNQTQGKLTSYKPGGGTEDAFIAKVVYTYTMDGRTYTSSKASRTGLVTSSVAERWKYQVGKPITVYYDPAAPGVSVLAPEMNSGYRSWVLLQLVLCAFIVSMAIWGFRRSYYREKLLEAKLPSNAQPE